MPKRSYKEIQSEILNMKVPPPKAEGEQKATTAKRFRAAYDPPLVVDKHFPKDDGRTQQQFTDACDINKIMERWLVTGQVTHVNLSKGRYGDFSNIQSFDQALNQIIEAEASFMELPAELRDRFNNNAGELIGFLEDPANLEEGRQLGLFAKEDPGMQNDAKPPTTPERIMDPGMPEIKKAEKPPPIIGGESP